MRLPDAKFCFAIPALLVVLSVGAAGSTGIPTAIRTIPQTGPQGPTATATTAPDCAAWLPNTGGCSATTVPTVTPTTVPLATDPAVLAQTEAAVVAVLAMAVGDSTNAPNVTTLTQQIATSGPAINSYVAVAGAVTSGPNISVWWTATSNALPAAGSGVIVAAMTGSTCVLAATNVTNIDPNSFSQYAGSSMAKYGGLGSLPATTGSYSATISPTQLAAGTFVCNASIPQQVVWAANLNWSTP